MADPSRRETTIFVGGLDQQVNSQTLHDAFIPFGDIVNVSLPRPELKSSADAHRGFGYVEFALAEDAREAIDNMDQSEIYGRVIKCNEAKPQKDHNEGLGSRTAVWEQEGYAAKFNVADGDSLAAGEEMPGTDLAVDPMHGLEGLDVAGPRMT